MESERGFLSELHNNWEIILSDFVMPQFGGLRALELLKASGLDTPFIIISGTIGEEQAVAAMKLGAADYLLKDRIGRLGTAVKRALEEKWLRAENKRAEEELRQTHAQLRNLLEHSATVIFTLKIDATTVVFTIVSGNIERLLGVTIAEANHCDWWMNSVHPDDRERVLAGRSKGIILGSYTMEYRVRHKNGSYLWVLDNNRILKDSAGQTKEMVDTWTDITERKDFERALRQTNVELENAKYAAERANQAKSDFLSSMTHELRTPLCAILGFAQLMESATPEPTASQTENITQILQAGWYLLKLINEVLDLAGIESGTMSVSKETVSLSEILSECRSMMEPRAQERAIRMTFPQFDTPVVVTTDRTRLKQIIINLISNAIKYNRNQGTVLVDCTVTNTELVRISVSDTGSGLSPEKLAQLSTPFNRLGLEAGSIGGTGIGLVVSKRLPAAI